MKVAISGANGRMGQTLIRLLQGHSVLELGLAHEHKGADCLNVDSGLNSGIAANGVPITDELDAQGFDLMIDFTVPQATMDNLEFCISHGKAMVIGTTGMTQDQIAKVESAGSSIPVILAANTSVGVNLGASLARKAAEVIGPYTDIEIIEAHHHHKVDAPSGTALFWGREIADQLDINLEEEGVFARHGQTGARKPGTIGFSTIRGGDIAGEHTVMFIGENERLEITHKATDRVIFGRGALRAAEWLSEKVKQGEKGKFTMREVLNLID